MSKILENTTGSILSVGDVGVSIPVSPATYTIQPTDYLLWAASSDAVTLVGDGSLIVNDGSSDLSISDGVDLIKGIFPTTIDSNVISSVLPTGASSSVNQTEIIDRIGPETETSPATDTSSSGLNGRLQRIAQRITSLIESMTTGSGILSTIRGATDGTQIGNESDSLKVVASPIDSGEFTTYKSAMEVTLLGVTTYTTLHSVTGSGVLVGATFVVDDDKVDCRIEVDGNIVFEFTGDFLKEVVNKDSSYRASGLFGVTNDGKRLYFTPSTPFKYNTSLVFKARKLGKKVKYQLYTYSEV